LVEKAIDGLTGIGAWKYRQIVQRLPVYIEIHEMLVIIAKG
jgi:hypothetical protein